MTPVIPNDLKHQLRQCANCKKSESFGPPIVRFRVCGKCKTHRYCSAECQRADWPNHKPRCKENSSWVEQSKDYDRFIASSVTLPDGMGPVVPLHAIYPVLQDWTATYRPLMCISLVNALGFADGPPNPAAYTPPQVFFISLSTVPRLTIKTKGRAAFLVEDALVLSLADFQRSVTDRSHRLYHPDNGQLMADYNRHKAQMGKEPTRRLTMVVQRAYFHNGVSAMMYNKNWYYEDDRTRDYSTQWKPRDWLPFFKQTVANGKGWDRDDVWF